MFPRAYGIVLAVDACIEEHESKTFAVLPVQQIFDPLGHGNRPQLVHDDGVGVKFFGKLQSLPGSEDEQNLG